MGSEMCIRDSNDIERATETARSMVTKYGMSDKLGPIMFGSSDSNEVFLGRDFGHTRNYSEEVAGTIDEEVSSIINTCYAQTRQKLMEHMDKLHAVARFLFVNEKVDGEQFKDIMEGRLVPEETDFVSKKKEGESPVIPEAAVQPADRGSLDKGVDSSDTPSGELPH